MLYEKQKGVPRFECIEYAEKRSDYVVLIPIINEGKRIHKELYRAYMNHVSEYADIVICLFASHITSFAFTFLIDCSHGVKRSFLTYCLEKCTK